MIKGTHVYLNEVEQRVAVGISKIYQQNAKKTGARERKVDQNRLPDTLSAQGIAGEMACAKLFDVYYRPSTEYKKRRHDLIINGYTVDVKTTEGNWLICPHWKKIEDSEIYILMLDRQQYYEYGGWCWADELIRPDNQGKEFYVSKGISRDTYVIEPYQIHGSNLPRKEKENVEAIQSQNGD